MTEIRRLVVTGVVQGVGFRYHMSNTALRLGISGWVRNCRDGSVESVITGAPESIAAMIDWAWVGPPAAQVRQIFVEQVEAADSFQGFQQRDTL